LHPGRADPIGLVVELGEYLCEVRSKQHWKLEKLNSFDEFLAKRFPESRRKAYYLMTIQLVARHQFEIRLAVLPTR
jgi:hypothetical protein